jgi:hypothetical protein
MNWYNPDWYYTQVPDEETEEDEEERIAAGEEQWERERDADL